MKKNIINIRTIYGIIAFIGSVAITSPVHANFTYTQPFPIEYVVVEECSDGIDNADTEDTLFDQFDPGCHADGNALNPLSYNADDNSEDDLIPSPECNDFIDNADPEDTLSDDADPGCHSDGDASNPLTHVKTDNDETDLSLPDLVAGNITPTTVTVNNAVNFSATITNQGSASTGVSFPNFFQVASDSAGATIIHTFAPGPDMIALGASSSAISTTPAPYTFTSTGTYYVRACADKSDAITAGPVAESVENNNCSAWAVITVDPDTSGAGVSLTALPSTIVSGNSSTLSIAASGFPGSISCRIDQGVGSVPMSNSGGGDWDSTNPDPTVSPVLTTTYTATCFSPSTGSASTYCASGTFSECGWADAIVTVTSSDPEICGNGIDDDLDGSIDEGCVVTPQCSDGGDNDLDTFTDEFDPGCHTDGDPYNLDTGLPGYDPSTDPSYDPNDPNESNRKRPIFIEF